MSALDAAAPAARTPLYGEHVALGARMVPFSGYEMPVNYALGVLKEHLWTREKAGLFDVAHMGIARLVSPSHAETAAALEALVPADIQALKPGQQRYTQLLTPDGGIIDDLMVTRPLGAGENGTLMLVVNAGRKSVDYAHLKKGLPAGVGLMIDEHLALLALQGPAAARVLARHLPGVEQMAFMSGRSGKILGADAHVTRSGYTGEDGYEIAVPATAAREVWRALLASSDVQPIGLGARDSLRLEAGLCLYGHDIDEATSPIEAGLAWSIQRRRRDGGGFPGAKRIQSELAAGPARRRVGLRPEGRAPAREGTEISTPDGRAIGRVTSGGFGPTANAPVAMGYVETASSSPGTRVALIVRGKPLPAVVTEMPFVPHRYVRRPT